MKKYKKPPLNSKNTSSYEIWLPIIWLINIFLIIIIVIIILYKNFK